MPPSLQVPATKRTQACLGLGLVASIHCLSVSLHFVQCTYHCCELRVDLMPLEKTTPSNCPLPFRRASSDALDRTRIPPTLQGYMMHQQPYWVDSLNALPFCFPIRWTSVHSNEGKHDLQSAKAKRHQVIQIGTSALCLSISLHMVQTDFVSALQAATWLDVTATRLLSATS